MVSLILLPISVADDDNLQQSLIPPKAISLDRSYLQNYVPGEVIVKFKHDVGLNKIFGGSSVKSKYHSIDAILDKHKIIDTKKVFRKKELQNINKLKIKGEKIIDLINDLNSNPFVEYAEPNYIANFFFIPNDPLYQLQWHHQNIESEAAWDIEIGKEETIIAIVDSGVRYYHEDLAANIWNNTDEIPNNGIDDDNNSYIDDIRGYDFVDENNDPDDSLGHGTHCAGIAAGVGNNSLGISGACPNCRIMPIKAGNYWLEHEDIAQALMYAADNNASIISMSFGGPESNLLESAINYAFEKGVALIASAGNSGSSAKSYPAGYENVLAVAATDINDQKAGFSNYGYWVDLAAPGIDVFSTHIPFAHLSDTCNDDDGDGYGNCSGTSMSAPLVSGVAGLVLSKNAGLSHREVYAQLIGTADNISNSEIGGRINSFKALNETPDKILVSYLGYQLDEQAKPGKIINLTVRLKNKGKAINDVIINLSSSDSCVNFINNTSYFSYIPIWTIVNNSANPFTLLISEDCPLRHIIEFDLELSVEGQLISNFRFTVPVGLYVEGWPVEAGSASGNHPTLEDIDHDGLPEILISLDFRLFVFNGDGSLVDGWPVEIPSGRNSPVVGDLDNDGEYEIIISDNWNIHVLNVSGNIVSQWLVSSECCLGQINIADLDKDGNLEILTAVQDVGVYAFEKNGTLVAGWPQVIENNIIHSYYMHPVVGDVIGDSYPEVIVGTYNEPYQVIVWHHNGTLVEGWPKNLTYYLIHPPSLADIDSDGKYEIFINDDYNLYIFKGDSNLLEGWPQSCRASVLGNIDKDKEPEIICGGLYSYAYNLNGSIVPGWPVQGGNTIFWDQSIGDIDGDGDVEVVSRDNSNKIFAWEANGTLVEGFPIEVGEYNPDDWGIETSVALGDINGDGKLDMITGPTFNDNHVYAYTGIGDGLKVEWPMYGHDPKHTRIYSYEVCDDGVDNDFDGLVDCADLDCDGLSCGTCKICSDETCSGTPADDDVCGVIDCDALDRVCRNYDDLTANRCEGFGDCKDSNTADCTSYTDSPVGIDCGICAECNGGGGCVYDETQDNDCSDTICPDACGLSPDNNPFTWDYADDVANECTALFICSSNNCIYSHECHDNDPDDGIDGNLCGAECDQDSDCEATDCDYLDGCVGNDYYDYYDVDNNCLGDCSCEQNECGVPIIYYDDSRCYRQFNITLNDDWNLISVPLVLDNNSILSTLSSIDGKYESIFAYNSSSDGWVSYNIERPEFLNTLTTIIPEKGYWIKMVENANLFINGTLPSSIIYNIKQGWNLIGYPYLTEQPVTIVFSDVNETYTSIFTFINSNWSSYSPEKPAFLNTLQTMQPGYGYWVKANDDVNWMFNGSYYLKP